MTAAFLTPLVGEEDGLITGYIFLIVLAITRIMQKQEFIFDKCLEAKLTLTK